jgi:hypothetical protein
MPENKEGATTVYAKKIHKGAPDEDNQVVSGEALVNKHIRCPDPTRQILLGVNPEPAVWIRCSSSF